MSEFGIASANVLERIRKNSPASFRHFVGKSRPVRALWDMAMRQLRGESRVRDARHPAYGEVLSESTAIGDDGRTVFNHAVYNELLNELAANGDDVEKVSGILRGWELERLHLNKYDALAKLLEVHPTPHRANLALAQYEMRNRIDEVRSFPWSVMMDLTSVCNIQCRFCKYEHNHLPKIYLPIDHIKQIEWFPLITSLNFSAGTAESIIHPHFNEIFDFVRDKYPHLFLQILTNGRQLTEAKLERFRDRLDWLYVSMNASNREDFDRVIYKGDWDKFSENMKHMQRVLHGAKRPFVQANFVMMQWNIDRATDYLEFAAKHGAHRVSFCHFYSRYIPDLHRENHDALMRKFTHKDSLYFAKEKSDAVFAQVSERAKELGVEVQIPTPFNKAGRIYFGNRTLGNVPEDCQEPWAEAFLLWGWKSKREEAAMCCGLASDIGAFFDREDIKSIGGFRRFWNQPILRAYRRTANGANINPICDLCRKIDRFDPEAVYPDQRDFFRYVGLPIPQHLEQAAGETPKVIEIKVAT